MQQLSTYFKGVAAKLLSEVEVNPKRSNQHEMQGIQQLRTMLGTERRSIPSTCIYLADEPEKRVTHEGDLSWYDSRERDEKRSAEFRLYYKSGNDALKFAAARDVLIVAQKHDETLLLLIVPSDSEQVNELLWIFGITDIVTQSAKTYDVEHITVPQSLLSYVADEAGIELRYEAQDTWLDLLLERFGPKFPTTKDLSALALETLQRDISPIEAPDSALISLIDREEEMFRQLERHIVSQHLGEHAGSWAQNVDDFVSFSLSVQNRRKSRAGHALENHLEWIFTANHLAFARGAKTEARSRPDFLFPGSVAYHDDSFPRDRLFMLGVKTTCKDRWRQVLNEAQRISPKHLLTLQPGISEHQIEEMSRSGIQLVVPRPLHASYRDPRSIYHLGGFIRLVQQGCV